MPALPKPVAPVDAWETPKETWVYVTIPDEDPLGKEFPHVSLNKHIFEAGKSYNVPSQVAEYVNDRIKVFNRSCIRLLQPNRDMVAVKDSAMNGGFGGSIQAVDASAIQTL